MRTTIFGLCLCAYAGSPLLAEIPSSFFERFDAGAAQRWRIISGAWNFGDGFVRPESSDSECAAGLAVRPDGPFYLAVRFRPGSSVNGVGLLFAMPDAQLIAGAMLVSCSPGGRILWGRFDETGKFHYTAHAAYDEGTDKEQELAIAVDPQKLAFSIFHNGESIALNVRTPVAGGFVGIRTSGGPHTITAFEVRPARSEELSGMQAPGAFSGMLDLIGDADSIIVLKHEPEFLALFNSGGYDVAWANVADVKGLQRERLEPVALTWFDWPMRDGNPSVLLLAEGGEALYLFDDKLHQLGDGPLVRVPEMRGAGVAIGPRGHMFVADAGIPGIRVFHAAGGELLKYGEQGLIDTYDRPDPKSAGKFKEPCAIAVNPKGEIVVLDRGNCTYSVYEYERRPNRLKWIANGPWLPAVDGVRFDQAGRLLLAGPFEFYHSAGALRVLTLDGLPKRVFTGAALGHVCARLRACQGPGNNYYLADTEKDRILVIPPDFIENPPQFEWTGDRGVKLTMARVDGLTVTSVSHERVDKDAGRILVRQSEPTCESWPSPLPDDLLTYSLPPALPRGKTYVIDLPVLVAVFTKAIDENGAPVGIDGTGVPDRLRRELEADRLFYWRVSRGTLNKQFEFMLIDNAEPKIDGGWIEPTLARTLVNEARQKGGLPAIGPDHSLVGIHPMPGFDPNFADDAGTVDGGGLTTFAYSSYALWNHGQAWLMAHEWGHQLDGFFDKSGFSDWWLNHPDGTVHIGRYGEHWDCNAFLCRRADKMNWLRLRYGTPRLVDDRDEDGLADDDPTLPLDEKRFGSDPQEPDSDLDGLSDLAEMAAGTFTSTDPLNRDTNGNGLIDSHDPYPQFAVKISIRRLNEQMIQRVLEGDSPERLLENIGTITSAWCDTDVYALYTPDSLTFLFKLRRPVQQVCAPVDFNNDGWFVGHDQVYPSVDLDWPPDAPARIRSSDACEAKLVLQPDGPVLLLKIAVPAARPPLLPHSSIGACPRTGNGPGRVAFLLDPWQLLSLQVE